ncbi:MAG: SdpI family protein [Akkermansiaceae bacterium]|nr:SdpI family protein [Armatimonadota bacterium]
MIHFFALLFIFVGLLMVGISVNMILGYIKPNNLVGFRTEKTLSSDAVWYPANEYAGKWLFGLGIGQVAIAMMVLLVPIAHDNFVLYAGVNTMALLVGTITMTFSSVAYSEKL